MLFSFRLFAVIGLGLLALVGGYVPIARGESADEKSRRYLEKARSAGNSQNRPVAFHGLVLDQNDQPVVRVTVECGLSYYNDIVLPGLKPHYDRFNRSTDGAGRFSIEGRRGLSLDLRFQEMEGSEFRPDALGVTLRDVAPNQPAPVLSTPDRPYVFRAFRKTKAEPLLKGSIFNLCETDGRSYIVSFRDNQIFEGNIGGDIKISFRRSVVVAQADFDWSVDIESRDMKFSETHDAFMYLAPAAEYEVAWSISSKAGDQQHARESHPKFYLKSRDGTIYGRVEVDLLPDYRKKFGVRLNYWLNPKGSRNLQFDPRQQINAVP